jgi:hypothetical protein
VTSRSVPDAESLAKCRVGSMQELIKLFISGALGAADPYSGGFKLLS